MKPYTFTQHLVDASLAGASSFGAANIVADIPAVTEATPDTIEKVVIPLVVGLIFPLIKDLLIRWSEKRKQRRNERKIAK